MLNKVQLMDEDTNIEIDFFLLEAVYTSFITAFIIQPSHLDLNSLIVNVMIAGTFPDIIDQTELHVTVVNRVTDLSVTRLCL